MHSILSLTWHTTYHSVEIVATCLPHITLHDLHMKAQYYMQPSKVSCTSIPCGDFLKHNFVALIYNA